MERICTRYQQISFLRLWNRSDVIQFATDVNPILRHFPSLFATSVAAIERLDPFQVGIFLSMMRKCAVGTALLLLQTSNPRSMPGWADTLRNFILSTCPCSEFADVYYGELNSLMARLMDDRRADDPRALGREASLVPILGRQGILRAELYNTRIVNRFYRAWILSLMPVFHYHLTFKQFYKVSEGLRKGGWLRGPKLPVPIIIRTPLAIPAEDEYRPAGDRIALTAFCQPAQNVPADFTCAVCFSDFEVGAEDDDQAVATSCNHQFHQTCLDAWVNDSAMSTANTCPSCRTVLCEGRRRVPASMAEEFTSVDDDMDDTDSLFFDAESRFDE